MTWSIVHRLEERHVSDLMRLYAGEWWSKTRTEAAVRRMLGSSDVVITAAIDSTTGTLVGFTRILTDAVFKAIVFDVIVSPEWRGMGITRALLDAALAHPRVRDVEHIELYCRDQHVGLYARWGFVPVSADLFYLRRSRPA